MGFVLQVPQENFLSAKPWDAGVINDWSDREKTIFKGVERGMGYEAYQQRLFEERGLPPPQKVITETGSYSRYNEVAIAKTGDAGKPVRVTGVFVNKPVYADGPEYAPKWKKSLSEARKIADDLHLPLVVIQQPR